MARITARLWIPEKLPAQNEMLDAAKKAHGIPYSKLKKATESRIESAIYEAALPAFADGARITYELVEPDETRDPGNILGGAMKFVEDALVRTHVLTGDGWRGISSYGAPGWRVSELDGVLVTIEGTAR